MAKIRSLLTAMVAGVAALSGTAKAQSVAAPAATGANAQYVNAPIMKQIPNAPRPTGHCGIFETCASTKIGLGRGDFMIRLSGVGVLPQDRDSKVSLNGTHLNGTHISTTNQAMPELTLEYFITDNLSVDLIATSTRHEVAGVGGDLASTVGSHKTDVGSAWVLPPTLTFAWHFRPHKRFNPYVGVGATAMWFHSMHASNAALPAGLGNLTKLNSGFTGGPSVNVGFDYQLVGNWFFNADVKQMFVRMHAWAQNQNESVRVKAHESLDPTVVSAGIAYRF
ncbi:OmpW/AlkL family protein [Acetobacter orientalis]|uniref:OmpW/AlkL family protein n=1 Tax=Acetobacter orientalis TaxID=146474 RepID=UPI0039EAAC0D